ncbi:MAG: sigma-70 family RNA polymerase sigma factor [Xanthomonadales bacterium]|nr:sigma-70 family RNA polymerase sigma factor [Xanthomonadales bacterium]
MNALVAEPAAIDRLIAAELPAARDGDRAAYGRIVAGCQNTVTAVALAITRDVQASEDIAQEAFLNAWQHLRRLQNPSSFLPWLRQIARNLARDHLRALAHRPLQGAGAELAIELAADPAPTPAERIEADERERAAIELISALPEDSRETLLLFYREGQSSQQVAALLGLSDAAVRKRLSRARQSLRDDLLARFGEFARDTAPGAAFTGVIATALSLASPPAAAKGVLGVTAAVGAKTFAKVVLGAAGSVAVPLLSAFAGIWLGLRRQLKCAIDEEERRGLVRSAGINALAAVGFLVTLIGLSRFGDGWLPPVIACAVFMGIVYYQSLVVVPRVTARRHALEAARDPVGAARKRRRERAMNWIGGVIGFVGGFGGLIYGLIASGRL